MHRWGPIHFVHPICASSLDFEVLTSSIVSWECEYTSQLLLHDLCMRMYVLEASLHTDSRDLKYVYSA